MLKIKRKRYIITKNDNTEIFCGFTKRYTFTPINAIRNTPIKTYSSQKKARNSLTKSQGRINFDYQILEITEIIEVLEQ